MQVNFDLEEKIKEIKGYFQSYNVKEKEMILKRSFAFSEAYSMFDLYGVMLGVERDTYLICMYEGTPRIMKRRPPRLTRYVESLNDLKEKNFGKVKENDDFDMYKTADSIVEEIGEKPLIILITTDTHRKLDLNDVSVLVVGKNLSESTTLTILMVDPFMTVEYQGIASNVHQRMASTDYKMKKMMIQTLFYNIPKYEIINIPLKFYGTIFQNEFHGMIFNRTFFPVLVMFLVNKTQGNLYSIVDHFLAEDDSLEILFSV